MGLAQQDSKSECSFTNEWKGELLEVFGKICLKQFTGTGDVIAQSLEQEEENNTIDYLTDRLEIFQLHIIVYP